MKLGLLLPTNVFFCPYVRNYTDILDENNIKYDIIYADKRGLKEKAAHRFNRKIGDNAHQITRLLYYLEYSSFLRRVIKKEQYDKLIVFGPQIAIFLKPFLKKHYKNKFILDYRDLSIEQKFKGTYNELMKLSALHVVSSPGFIKCLPNACSSILSHNFDINTLKRAINDHNPSYELDKGQIEVLTIGGIRNYEQNAAIIEALGDKEGFLVTFAGNGIDAHKLEEKDANDITPNENKKLKEARDLVKKFEKSEKEKVKKIENKQYKDITDEDIENLENSKKSQTLEGSKEYLSKLFHDVIKSGEEIKETRDKNAKLEAKILSHPDIKAYEREAILSEIEKERDSEIKKVRALSNQKERNTEVNELKEVEDYIASIPVELNDNPIKGEIDSEFKRLKYHHLGIESEKQNVSEEEYNDLVAESLENLKSFVKDSEDKVNKAILEEIEIANERIAEYEKTKNDLVISGNKEEDEIDEIEEEQPEDEIDEIEEQPEVESEPISNFPTRKETTFWSKTKGWFSNVKDKIKGKLRERFALEEDVEEELNENEVVNEPEVEISNEKLTKEEQKEVYEKLTKEEQKEVYEKLYGEDERRERIRRRIKEAKMRAEANVKNKQNQEKETEIDDEIEL